MSVELKRCCSTICMMH
ncbi:BnaC03g72640D [Brassica napus]|uniref:BnaC03g72640D protein n=1 Tax=Brassica napus TaxID=3708 RepID=A0A078JQK9_BRANA|nr:BnaC03g72640D [Brassica napus]